MNWHSIIKKKKKLVFILELYGDGGYNHERPTRKAKVQNDLVMGKTHVLFVCFFI